MFAHFSGISLKTDFTTIVIISAILNTPENLKQISKFMMGETISYLKFY